MFRVRGNQGTFISIPTEHFFKNFGTLACFILFRMMFFNNVNRGNVNKGKFNLAKNFLADSYFFGTFTVLFNCCTSYLTKRGHGK